MNYQFLNINPLNNIEKDCVTRAIALALNKDYYLIARKLKLIAELFDCDKLCVCCYKHLLDNVYCLTRIEEYNGKKIKDFIDKYPYGTYIIRVEGHLTTVINGVCYDIWNATNEKIDIIWQV